MKMEFSDILPEDVEADLKRAAEISMGTEIADMDLLNIRHLCEEITEMSDYRYVRRVVSVLSAKINLSIGFIMYFIRRICFCFVSS